MKTPWKSEGGGDKEAKIKGRSYEITEIPRGGGDKTTKIWGRPYKIIEIPRKFLAGELVT